MSWPWALLKCILTSRSNLVLEDSVTDDFRMVYRQGDHVCALYASPEQQLAAAIEYIQGGLSRGERCLYICGEHSPAQFRDALREAGIDVDAEERRGALILLTKFEAHLKDGSFEPARMIEVLKRAVTEALEAGFSGLAAAGDMNWVIDEAPGTEKLAEYEALLNRFYRENRALGLCLYNRRSIPSARIDDGIGTHAYIRMEGPILVKNPFYEEPEVAARRTARPADAEWKIAELARKVRLAAEAV